MKRRQDEDQMRQDLIEKQKEQARYDKIGRRTFWEKGREGL